MVAVEENTCALEVRADALKMEGVVVLQHGRTGHLAEARLGACASSGRAWRLWAAQHSYVERPGH